MSAVPETDCGRAVAAAAALDAAGFAVAPGESATVFFERAERTRAAQSVLNRELQSGPVRPAPGITLHRQNRIPEAILAEAREITAPLYDFAAERIPGFFADERFGALWGGCTLSDPESGLDLFLIRKAFRNRKRWFIYDRSELLAHELCHAARQGFDDPALEEFYAYRTSRSALRRYLGGCFAGRLDALWFLLPALLLPVVQSWNVWGKRALPMAPFWIFCAAVWGGFLVRNQWRRCRWLRARKALLRCGVAKADAVLFRTVFRELPRIARLQDRKDWGDWLQKQSEKEFRWQVVAARFGGAEAAVKE